MSVAAWSCYKMETLISHYLKEKERQYPEFTKLLESVRNENPLQSKRLFAFTASQDDSYWSFCESLCDLFKRTVLNSDEKIKAAVRAYNELCLRMLRDQIQFKKTKVYPSADAASALKEVYSNKDVMRSYMLGLLLTQMFWPNHYKLFRFFESQIKYAQPKKYLEIGSGHGLFVAEALRQFPSLEVTICDISETSLTMSREILNSFGAQSKIEFVHRDFLEFSYEKRDFDFVCLGEVLEHADDAEGFLRCVLKVLSAKGHVYLSTCANCPAVDHVYHFHNVNEIRNLLRESGFIIDEEIFLPAEDVVPRDWEKELVTINYAVILRPRITRKNE